MIENYKDILKVGMEIKNYKYFCKLLNEDVQYGNSKKAQHKEWLRHFNYEKQGHKFIITEIYDTPKEKQDLRKNNGAFKHGKRNTLIYNVWKNMKGRCNNPNYKVYKNYGGRGIKVCDEWQNEENGFINFYNWAIENGYKERSGLSIDRIDVNGNYEPNNCRWVDSKIQTINRRNSKGKIINAKTNKIPIKSTKIIKTTKRKKKKKDYIIQVIDGLYLTHLILSNKTYPVGTFFSEQDALNKIDELYKEIESL